jgi:probable rRNA maturation factor
MSNIHFFSELPSYSFEHTKSWSEWLIACAKEEGYDLSMLNIIGMSDEQLLQINQEYLDHDTLTDVITFPLSIGKEIEGEIYLSVERAQENASQLALALQDEVCRLTIHGLLHLMGYTDKTSEDKAVMTSEEDYYLTSRTF